MTALNRREAILAGAAAVLLPSVAEASVPAALAGVESDTITACWNDCVVPTFIKMTITDCDGKVIFESDVACKSLGSGEYVCEVPQLCQQS